MLAFTLFACTRGVSAPQIETGTDTAASVDTAAETDTGDTASDTAPTDTAAPDTGDTAAPDTAADDTAVDDTASKALCAILRLDDDNGDGRYNSGYRSQVDASGNLLFKEYTDGSGVASTRLDYAYDAMNDLLVQIDDLDADGVADVTYTWTYDAYGNELTLVTTGLSDANYAWSYTYDADGRVLIGEYDGYYDHTDGIVDERDVFTYDADGHAVTASYDYDVDGVSELTVTWSWDADGRELTEAWDYEMTDGWGTPYVDYGWAYIYDAVGNVLVVAYDSGLDGANPDVWTYTYDADGNVLTGTTDYYGDGVVDDVETYTYDADGNVLTRESVSEYGTATWVYSWGDGRMTRFQVARDGALAWWQEYSYDAAGDLTEMVEYDAAGTPDYRESYTYDCG